MRKLSPALVISIIALFVALGGAGMAATGGNFILGKANSATSTTSLSAPIGGKALQVSNLSTASGATALGLTAVPGHAPLTVNSSAGKATNLNADRLDGIDSSGFVHGRGTALANRIVFLPKANKTLLTIPGLGYLDATCTSNDAYVSEINNTGASIDGWNDELNSHFAGYVLGTGQGVVVVSHGVGVNGGTLALGVGSDPNARRAALLHVFANQGGIVHACRFQAQGTLWTSP